MTIIKLSLVDPALVDDDTDTWIESCLHCGTLDNGGDNFCPACDDLAA
jgi:RNA polymerase subunit RPABC4/transcription elongation factor Spt4